MVWELSSIVGSRMLAFGRELAQINGNVTSVAMDRFTETQ